MAGEVSDGKKRCHLCVRQVWEEIFGIHLSYCRQGHVTKEDLWQCDYNPIHVLPMSEKAHHLECCPERPFLPLSAASSNDGIIFVESKEKAPRTVWFGKEGLIVGSADAVPLVPRWIYQRTSRSTPVNYKAGMSDAPTFSSRHR